MLALTEQYAGVFAAVGVHPNSSAEWQQADIDRIRKLAQHPKVVAIGEIGVDYYWDKSPQTTQHAAFSAQMALAAELDLPVIIHNREASEDTVALMAASPLAGQERAGVMHSFQPKRTSPGARSRLLHRFYRPVDVQKRMSCAGLRGLYHWIGF